MRVDELDFILAEELIAQRPMADRDKCRLLHVNAADGALRDHVFSELPDLLAPSLIVFNNTKVIPARLFGAKVSGGRVEVLLIERLSGKGALQRWVAMLRASKALKAGASIVLDGTKMKAKVLGRNEEGHFEVELRAQEDVDSEIRKIGHMPLPPYIRREDVPGDRSDYQTVFARHEGAVAAPTAGLHFTGALLERIHAAGHQSAEITLHVGPGTFRPVKCEDLNDHDMHEEVFEVPESTFEAMHSAKQEGRRIVAVGTTVVRALESCTHANGELRVGRQRTGLLIQPPYSFRWVDDLITNFHLPRSTLLALVMAFASPEIIRHAYAHATRNQYRFFSYGDAMLISKSAS